MDEKETMLARLGESARIAARTGLARYSCFLDPAQAQSAFLCAHREGVHVALWGGYQDAERVVARFSDAHEEASWPIVCLRALRNTRFASAITHRDVLGAAMALGLKRERLGDILISGEAVFLFTLEENAGYIAANLVSAGRETLGFEPVLGDVSLPEPEGRKVHDTVASLRLDAVLGAAFDLSRAQAQEAIRAGKVRLDHVEELRTDAQVDEGALISLRGTGRARLLQVGSLTRKGRIGVEIFRYV